MAIDLISPDELSAYRQHVLHHLWRASGLKSWTDSRVFLESPSSAYRAVRGTNRLHVTVPPDNGTRWVLGDLGVDALLKTYSEDVPTYAHYTYDLYITTGWLKTSSDEYLRFRADPEAGKQEIWRSYNGCWTTITNGYTTQHDLTPIAWRDLPDHVRRSYMHTLARNIIDPVLRHQHQQTIDSLGNQRGSHGRIYWRGRWMTAHHYQCLKDAFREFADMLADPDTQNCEIMAELLEDVSDAGGPASDMYAIWNRECEIGNEVDHASGCGHYHTGRNYSVHGGGTVCEPCLEEDYVWAEDVGDYVLEEDAHYYNGAWHYYEEDDEDYEDDDGYPSGVFSYGANVLDYCAPDTRIVPSIYGEFLLGVELEVEALRAEVSEASEDTADFFDGYAILKHDGSLGRGGFEIVTAPRGLPEHIEVFKGWEPHSSLRAWDTGRCGMHVHISSQAFTQATLGKFIEFINSPANDQFIEAIAGRHPDTNDNAAEYCQREGTLHTGNPKKTVEGKSSQRYRMVNTQNLSRSECRRLGMHEGHACGKAIDTIELRIFRATLKKERLLAQIEFAHAAVMFCRWASFRALTGREFLVWLQDMAGQYPNLARWFGVRANTKKVDPQPKVRETADV